MKKEIYIVYGLFFVVFFVAKIAIDYFLFHQMTASSLGRSFLMAIVALGLFVFLTYKQFRALKKQS